jgi:hypothetical protein
MDKGMTAKAPPPLEFQFNEKNFYIVWYVSVCQESVQGMLELACHHCYHKQDVVDCRMHKYLHNPMTQELMEFSSMNR